MRGKQKDAPAIMNGIRPVSYKGVAKKLKPGKAPLVERPNGFMGVGLESLKYRREFLKTYVKWMRENLERSVFFLGDAELDINSSVFGYNGDVDSRARKKYGELQEIIHCVGDPERMIILPSWKNDDNSDEMNGNEDLERTIILPWGDQECGRSLGRKFDYRSYAGWLGMLTMGLDFPEKIEGEDEPHYKLKEDIHGCLLVNMRKRLEEYRKSRGEAQYGSALSTLYKYAISEIAQIVEIITSGVTLSDKDGQAEERIKVSVKVGPTEEGGYDKIIYRLLEYDERYNNNPHLAKMRGIMRRLKIDFGTVYFAFTKNNVGTNGNGDNGKANRSEDVITEDSSRFPIRNVDTDVRTLRNLTSSSEFLTHRGIAAKQFEF